MKTYIIPRGDLSQADYYDYVQSLPWVWAGSLHFSIDPTNSTVQAEATITGFDELVVEPLPATTVETNQTARLIDVGPFFDRFGSYKMAVLLSTNLIVKAFLTDLSNRHWVDLDRPDVKAAVYFLAGVPIPGLGSLSTPIITTDLANTVITTPVTLDESTVLRKLYFS